MKDTTKKELKIGLSVIGALVILYFGIEFLKGHSPFRSHTVYHAVYDNVHGLTATANVTLSGVKVGQVSAVELMPEQPGRVLVSFRLDQPVNLTKGSTASVEKDLLGSSSLVLNLAQGSELYQSGDTIGGQVNSGLMSEVSEMLPNVTNLVPKIDSLLTNINNVIGNPSLNNTINNLENVTNSLQGVVSNVNRATAPLPKIMNGADSIVKTINAISADLNTLSATIANAPIDTTLNNVNRISENLAQITDALSSPDSSLGQLINDSAVYDNLKTVTADIDSLIVDIKRNPKRYISIKLL